MRYFGFTHRTAAARGVGTEHPAAPTRQVAHHRTDEAVGYQHGDLVDRLEQGHLRRGSGLPQRQRTGHLEREVRGVDAVSLAVEQGHPDIDHRITCVHTLFHLRAHALLYTWDELPWHRSADHLIEELESGALRQRLHLDVAHRVLAVSAGLLNVAAMAFGFAAEGFSERDAEFDGVYGYPVPVGQRVEHNTGMGLAHAPEHDLVRFLVLFDPQRRVFRGQAPQPDRQFVFVSLGVRLYSDRQQRLGHRP